MQAIWGQMSSSEFEDDDEVITRLRRRNDDEGAPPQAQQIALPGRGRGRRRDFNSAPKNLPRRPLPRSMPP